MKNGETVLVLGATGGIGSEVARQLRDAGWRVRGLRRRAGSSQEQGIEWSQGDAMNRVDVERAAQGVSVIVHAVNPPGYRRWSELVLPMLDNTISAAKKEGATIMLPGTVYNFGPDAFPLIDENAPQHPVTKKGAIRVEMEARLQRASKEGARVIIVRAGDFFGPNAGNNWFSQGLVKPGQPVKKISNPGTRGVGHEWSYLPDVARTMRELLAHRDTLEAFARFHMAGFYDDDGTKFTAAIQRVVEKNTGNRPRISAFPWWLLMLASPLNATFREMREMRYLWREPIRMTNTHLVDTLGHEPHTPLDEAIEATLRGLRCL
jgi:nucleoside-diphosphate-sugar epimerase